MKRLAPIRRWWNRLMLSRAERRLVEMLKHSNRAGRRRAERIMGKRRGASKDGRRTGDRRAA